MAIASTFLLNKMADAATADDWTARAHTGNPGNNGTSNRIAGSPTPTLTAANWTNASAGDTNYGSDLAFGVIDSASARSITWLSLYEGSDWVGNVEMDATVVVAVGGTFTVNSGTIDLNGMTA